MSGWSTRSGLPCHYQQMPRGPCAAVRGKLDIEEGLGILVHDDGSRVQAIKPSADFLGLFTEPPLSWVSGSHHQGKHGPFLARRKDRLSPANPQQHLIERDLMPLVEDRLGASGLGQSAEGGGTKRPEAADEQLLAHALETLSELRIVHEFPPPLSSRRNNTESQEG